MVGLATTVEGGQQIVAGGFDIEFVEHASGVRSPPAVERFVGQSHFFPTVEVEVRRGGFDKGPRGSGGRVGGKVCGDQLVVDRIS